MRANDSNPGTKEAPWQHHPWDPNALSVAKNSTGINTYVFKKGVFYRGQLVAEESGEAENPICLTVDPERFGADRNAIIDALAREDIEARPVWKPLHLQPVFKGCSCRGGSVAEDLFARGLCLPSGSNLTIDDLNRISSIVKNCRGHL